MIHKFLTKISQVQVKLVNTFSVEKYLVTVPFMIAFQLLFSESHELMSINFSSQVSYFKILHFVLTRIVSTFKIMIPETS